MTTSKVDLLCCCSIIESLAFFMIGQPVLTVAVLSILIAAPFGAIFMDNSYKKLLEKD